MTVVQTTRPEFSDDAKRGSGLRVVAEHPQFLRRTAPGGDAGSSRPPINQVMDSILGMALQLPALKSIGDSIGYDFSGALPKGGGPEGGGKS